MAVAFFILETKDILNFTYKHMLMSKTLGLYPICSFKFVQVQLLTTPEGGDNPSHELTDLH